MRQTWLSVGSTRRPLGDGSGKRVFCRAWSFGLPTQEENPLLASRLGSLLDVLLGLLLGFSFHRAQPLASFGEKEPIDDAALRMASSDVHGSLRNLVHQSMHFVPTPRA